jgi:hypothetical protein
MNLATCIFTNTADKHFVVDVHPTYPQVAFASPCSGHGFKFASVIGEIMADLAEVGMTRHDISLFRLERLLQPGGYAGVPAGLLDGRAAHSAVPPGGRGTEALQLRGHANQSAVLPGGYGRELAVQPTDRRRSFPRAVNVQPPW